MSIKGSERRSESEQIELKRSVDEFLEKLEHDPYQPNLIHPGIGVDDLQEIAEDALFLRGFSEVIIKVKKDADGFSVTAEVLSRTK